MAHYPRGMQYRPPTWTPSTRWARRLDAVMRENGWSKVRLFEEIGADLGYSPKSRTAIYPLLQDKEPSPREEAVLVRHFGPLPDEPERETTKEPDQSLDVAGLLVAVKGALDAHVQALADVHTIIGELRAEVAEARSAGVEERGVMLDALAGLQARLELLGGLANTASGHVALSPDRNG